MRIVPVLVEDTWVGDDAAYPETSASVNVRRNKPFKIFDFAPFSLGFSPIPYCKHRLMASVLAGCVIASRRLMVHAGLALSTPNAPSTSSNPEVLVDKFGLLRNLCYHNPASCKVIFRLNDFCNREGNHVSRLKREQILVQDPSIQNGHR